MTDIFELIINLSLTGSLVILLLLAVRIPLNRISKKYSYRLWALAAVKLVCPVSLWSVVTRINSMKTSSAPVASAVADNAVKAVSETGKTAAEVIVPAKIQEVHTGAMQAAAVPADHLTLGFDIAQILTAVWIAGAVILLLLTVIKAVRTARGLRTAEHVSGNIYRSYKVSSPFVFGIIRPRIYMPKELTEEDYPFLLRHEQTHIRRHDLVFKIIWIALLSVHWFNPLVWIAYRFFERDMEMSCDEEVIKQIDRESRADYCSSLVNFARLSNQPKSMIIPVNFGKNDVKERIESIMKYRKLSKKASAAAILTFALAATGCIFSPDKKELKVEVPTAATETTTETTAETSVITQVDLDGQLDDVKKVDLDKDTDNTTESSNEDVDLEKVKESMPNQNVVDYEVSGDTLTGTRKKLMGYDDWKVEKKSVEWDDSDTYHSYGFYAADGTQLGYYGGTVDNDYFIKDYDGDGITELVCNMEYAADGAKRFIVFRNNNGKIEMAEDDWDYVGELFGREIQMVGEIETSVDLKTGKLMVYDKQNDYKPYEYDYSRLKFEPISEN